MAYAITQDDIYLLRQKPKTVYIKTEVLTSDYKIIYQMESNLIAGNMSEDAESSIRKTFSASFISNKWIQDHNYWIDKYIRPYIGYESIRLNKIIWYKIGTFKVNTHSTQYNATTNQVDLRLCDLMATVDGTLGGTISSNGSGATSLKIEAESDLRNAIIAVVQDAGIKRFNICEFTRTVPYDIEVDMGSTYCQLLEELITLYAGYEFFFDEDGTFIMQLKPLLKSDPVLLSNEILEPMVISETNTFDYSNVYNYCEVFGQQIDADYYCPDAAGNSSAWSANNTEITEYKNGDIYGIKAPATNSESLTININNLGAVAVFNDNGKALADGAFKSGDVVCFKYNKIDNRFIYLGEGQAFGYYEEKSPECPFSTANTNRIVKVLTDDNIYSDSLCEQRAKYEIYLSCWCKDSLTIEILDIPFLSVNQKLSYKRNNSKEVEQYITQNINRDFSTMTMSVSMIKFSEQYPDMESIYNSQYKNE